MGVTGKPAVTIADQEKIIQEAIKENKRKEIQGKIDQWNEILNKVKLQKANLGLQQIILNTYLRKWETQKTTYSGNVILADVVILNVFEGVCADKIKEDLTDSITQMDKTYSGVSRLNDNVGLQISRLNEYIELINGKITSLISELNSI